MTSMADALGVDAQGKERGKEKSVPRAVDQVHGAHSPFGARTRSMAPAEFMPIAAAYQTINSATSTLATGTACSRSFQCS